MVFKYTVEHAPARKNLNIHMQGQNKYWSVHVILVQHQSQFIAVHTYVPTDTR